MDLFKLKLLKNKEEHAQSAVASQEVKEHLANFISQRQGSSGQLNNQQQLQQQSTSRGGTSGGNSRQKCSNSKYSSSNYNNINNLINQYQYNNQDQQYNNINNNNNINNVIGANVINQNDDHPLRKTASMPTMHIPYKAQSLSKRRQMERRTTMSPLMKRKSKPRRQLLQLQDSNSTEYSSNPCIIHSSRFNTRSLSQSSSPPPSSYSLINNPSSNEQQNNHAQSNKTTIGNGIPQQQQQQSSSFPSSQTIKIAPTSASFNANADNNNNNNNANVNNNQDGIPTHTNSTTNLLQQQQSSSFDKSSTLNRQQHIQVNEALRNSIIKRAPSKGKMIVGGSLDIETNLTTSIDKISTKASGNNNVSFSGGNLTSLRDELRQWSLDAAECSTGTSASALNKLVSSSSTSAGFNQIITSAASTNSHQAQAAGGTNTNQSYSFHKLDFHKLRLSTTSDAAVLRRSQSPSSSISMGLSGNLATASMFTGNNNSLSHQQQQQHHHHPLQQQQQQNSSNNIISATSRENRIKNTIAAHLKHYSSSSSSTSSLLSQQDSLEESSSQAIDLSSSSEASRQLKNHNQICNNLIGPSTAHMTHLANHLMGSSISTSTSTSASNNTTTGSNQNLNNPPLCKQPYYQKVLQESFKELGLCKSQEGIKQMILSNNNSASQSSASAQQQRAGQQQSSSLSSSSLSFVAAPRDGSPHNNNTNNLHHHHHHQQNHPSLLNASKTASSLDATSHHLKGLPPAYNQGSFIATLSKQFNLSASAQNLISSQEQQNSGAHLAAAPSSSSQAKSNSAIRNDNLNQYLLAYNNLLMSADLKQSNQITSTLLAEMTSLPDPFRANILTHLLQQQQLRAATINQQQASEMGADISSGDDLVQAPADDQTRSLISRALSSPLLVSSVAASQFNDSSIVPQELMMAAAVAAGVNTNNNITNNPLACHQQSILLRQQQSEGINFAGGVGGVKEEKQNSDQSTDMIIDSFDVTKQAKPINSNQFESSFSLDLSTKGSKDETNINDVQMNIAVGASGAVSLESSNSNNKYNFNYTPTIISKKVNCNFIYNPIFDKNSNTGLIYDLQMCNHKCHCGIEKNHPENSLRILAIWHRLYDTGLMAKCAKIEARKATLEEIQLCHSETYSFYFGKSPYERIRISQLDLSKLPIEGLTQLECGGQGADIDTAWNEEQTPGVARLAAGCVIESAICVAKGKLMNAFAVVRPPGHHAEYQQAMGFCFFNSVAIAAKVLIKKHQLARILIVDWDVHHGNGIQKMFYDNKQVMYISLHRHDKGNFFPGTGNIGEIGTSAGEGFNWNIAWSGHSMGDAEYLAAFRTIVMPISKDFNPSIILVSCGFDGARGHPYNFGGYDLSPACYSYMTRQLMALANGRIVLCLEGGYLLEAICDCAESCVRALLNESHLDPNDQFSDSELNRKPDPKAIDVLYQVSDLAMKFWPSVQMWRKTIEMSALEASNH